MTTTATSPSSLGDDDHTQTQIKSPLTSNNLLPLNEQDDSIRNRKESNNSTTTFRTTNTNLTSTNLNHSSRAGGEEDESIYNSAHGGSQVTFNRSKSELGYNSINNRDSEELDNTRSGYVEPGLTEEERKQQLNDETPTQSRFLSPISNISTTLPLTEPVPLSSTEPSNTTTTTPINTTTDSNVNGSPTISTNSQSTKANSLNEKDNSLAFGKRGISNESSSGTSGNEGNGGEGKKDGDVVLNLDEEEDPDMAHLSEFQKAIIAEQV